MEEIQNWDLIAKFLSGKASAEEKTLLLKWLEEDDENKEAFELQKKLWSHTNTETIDFGVEERWRTLAQQIKEERGQRISLVSPYLRIAATFVFLIVATLLLKLFVFDRVEEISVTSSDKKMKVTLPDQSVVWLNAESELLYPTSFDGNERRVELTGEAFFEVSKNKEKPFIIVALGTEIKVLGTSFNVRAQAIEKEVEVVVATGKVVFSPLDKPDQSIALLPGDKAVYNKTFEKLVKEQKGTENYASWKTGILKFQNATMAEVISDLEKHYQVDLNCRNLDILNCKITTTFKNQKLDQALEELQILLDVEVEREKKQILISGSGCN